MRISGRVKNGVVILEKGATLPEGTAVTVSPRATPVIHRSERRRRVTLPLVPSRRPGSLRLTAERVAELLEQDDLSARR